MFFQIVGLIDNVETIARGQGIRSRSRLRKKYGGGNWRKMKGKARVRLPNGTEHLVEVHWYEAHGVGKKEFKIKKFLAEE